MPNWNRLIASMLSNPKLYAKEEVDFEVIRDFRIPNSEELLLEETLCSTGLSWLPEGESTICHLLILAYSFLLLC